MSRFCTINQIASEGVLSAHRLRCLLKQGKLPGFYAGTRFMVNREMLEQRLTEWSEAGKDEAQE